VPGRARRRQAGAGGRHPAAACRAGRGACDLQDRDSAAGVGGRAGLGLRPDPGRGADRLRLQKPAAALRPSTPPPASTRKSGR
jgi:hypothetical protein